MKTPNQVKTDFYEYLEDRFGPPITGLIQPPAGVNIGERVLYQLVEGQEAQRADTNQANQEIEEEFAKLVSRLSEEIDGLKYHTEPVVSSGLPYPRTVDIPQAASLALGSLAVTYAKSQDELPEKNFPILWLYGVIFTYSAKYLLYLDFTHPKVRAVYVAEYDDEFTLSAGQDIPRQLQAFMIRQADMSNMVDDRRDIHWAKLVQTDNDIWTTIMTGDDFIQEQSRNLA